MDPHQHTTDVPPLLSPLGSPLAFQFRSLSETLPDESSPASASAAVRKMFQRQERPISLSSQLYAILRRLILLRKRHWCLTLLEALIPIFFVVVTVCMWLAFDSYYYPESIFNNTTAINYEVPVKQGMCYSNASSPIGDLEYCPSTNYPYVCSEGVSVPPGLCFLQPMPYATYSESAQMLLRTFPVKPVAPWHIPPFDEMILYQWCVRAEFGEFSRDFGAAAFSASGLDDKRSPWLSQGFLIFVGDSDAELDAAISCFASSPYFPYVYGGKTRRKDADSYILDFAATKPVWAALEVRHFNAEQFSVVLRQNRTGIPSTENLLATGYYGGLKTSGNELYLKTGFSTLQSTISRCYLEKVHQQTLDSTPFLAPMATASYEEVEFLLYGSFLIPLIFVMALLYPLSVLAKSIVWDREQRIVEATRIMGLQDVANFLAWLIIYVVHYAVTSLVIAIILRFTYFRSVDLTVLFLLFFLFAVSTIPLALLISSFFDYSRTASLLVPVIYFVLSLPTFAMTRIPSGLSWALLVLSPTAFSTGISQLSSAATGSQAVDFHALNRAIPPGGPSLGMVLLFLVIDWALYTVIGMYLYEVIPHEWGTARSPWFIFTTPYQHWRRWREGDDHWDVTHATDVLADGRNPFGIYEPTATEDETIAVRLCGLRKVFQRGDTEMVAVNNLHLTIRHGEVSVLLGHNGAGKSTAIGMLTGLVTPDGGFCNVYGADSRQNLSLVRQRIGFCPQHNILWPDLTCREHLEFFARIKGINGDDLESAVQEALDSVDLTEKEHFLSSNLSGGQKRKLSVAIAFVGQAPLVILDEPTAGMDVTARRHTWGLLQKMSRDRAILLTTHFMDEADLLGHSVAIMSHGTLQCCGSSLFLKSRLGVGYCLVLSLSPAANRASLVRFVQKHVSEAEVIGNPETSSGDLSLRLPTSAVSAFPALLSALENNRERNGVLGYVISATTLEEVFLGIAHGKLKSPEPVEPPPTGKAPEAGSPHLPLPLSLRGHRRIASSTFALGASYDSVASLAEATRGLTVLRHRHHTVPMLYERYAPAGIAAWRPAPLRSVPRQRALSSICQTQSPSLPLDHLALRTHKVTRA